MISKLKSRENYASISYPLMTSFEIDLVIMQVRSCAQQGQGDEGILASHAMHLGPTNRKIALTAAWLLTSS
jgi:hypothetical protein